MGHQIGKDGISLKSKMNVLKSMVPSLNNTDDFTKIIIKILILFYVKPLSFTLNKSRRFPILDKVAPNPLPTHFLKVTQSTEEMAG